MNRGPVFHVSRSIHPGTFVTTDDTHGPVASLACVLLQVCDSPKKQAVPAIATCTWRCLKKKKDMYVKIIVNYNIINSRGIARGVSSIAMG